MYYRIALLTAFIVLLCTHNALAQGGPVTDRTVTVYQYRLASEQAQPKLVEQFEWLDLARWYRIISLFPVQPVIAPGTRPLNFVPDRYLITEVDKDQQRLRDITIENDIVVMTTYQTIYRYRYDVKELQEHLTKMLPIALKEKDDTTKPALLKISMQGQSPADKDAVWIVRDQKIVDAIAVFLTGLPVASEVDRISDPANFNQPGRFHFEKMVTGYPAIPPEFDLADHQIRIPELITETRTYRDRANLIGEIKAARKFIELLKSQGLPLRKQY